MKHLFLQWVFGTTFAGIALSVAHVLGHAPWVMNGYELSGTAWAVIVAMGALWAALYAFLGTAVAALSWSQWKMVKGTGPLALIVLLLVPITPGIDFLERFGFAALMLILWSALIWGDLVRPDDSVQARRASWFVLAAGALVHFGAVTFLGCISYLPPDWQTDLARRVSAGVSLMGGLFIFLGAGVVMWTENAYQKDRFKSPRID